MPASVGLMLVGVGALLWFQWLRNQFQVGREYLQNPNQSMARNGFSYHGIQFGRLGEDKILYVPGVEGAQGVIPMRNHWHDLVLHGDVPDKTGQVVRREGNHLIELSAGHNVEPNNYNRLHDYTKLTQLDGGVLTEVQTYVHKDSAPGWISPFFHPFNQPGTTDKPVLLQAACTHYNRPLSVRKPIPEASPLEIPTGSLMDLRTPRSLPTGWDNGWDETHSGWDGNLVWNWQNGFTLKGVATYSINGGEEMAVPDLHKFTCMGPICAEPVVGRANGLWLERTGKIAKGQSGIVVRHGDVVRMTYSQELQYAA